MGEASAAARVRPTRAGRATAGLYRPTLMPPRADSQRSRFPVRQVAARPARAPSPARRSRPPRPPPGRGTENLESWQPGESANARLDPRFPDSQLADSRSLPWARSPREPRRRSTSARCSISSAAVRRPTAVDASLVSTRSEFRAAQRADASHLEKDAQSTGQPPGGGPELATSRYAFHTLARVTEEHQIRVVQLYCCLGTLRRVGRGGSAELVGPFLAQFDYFDGANCDFGPGRKWQPRRSCGHRFPVGCSG